MPRRFLQKIVPSSHGSVPIDAWHVRFKDGHSVVFLFEFQSSVDRDMALRMLHYTAAALTTLRNNETLLDPDGALPLVLASATATGCLTCCERSRKTCCRRTA